MPGFIFFLIQGEIFFLFFLLEEARVVNHKLLHTAYSDDEGRDGGSGFSGIGGLWVRWWLWWLE